MGTKQTPGTFDCYNNAADDEPMFILLGRDPVAGKLVRQWVEERRKHCKNEPGQLKEALECAEAMDAHARKLGKLPL